MLHMKRMKKERQFVEQAIMDGEISSGVWSSDGVTLKVSKGKTLQIKSVN